jgi:O-antigen ligase
MLKTLRRPFAALQVRPATGWIIFGLLMLFLLSSSFSIALTQIGYFGALILWVGTMTVRREFTLPRTPLDLFFLFYAAAELLACTFAIDVPYAFLLLQRRLLIIPIIYVLAGATRSVDDVKVLFGALLASATGVALYSLIPVILHLADFLAFRRRLGEFQIYMTAGGIMMIALLLVIPFLVHRSTPRKVRIVLGLVALPMLVNLYFTFTRSSWLGMIAGIVVIGALRTRKVLFTLLAALVIVVAASPPAILQGRILAIFDPSHPYNVTRVNMWHVGWKVFLDHPVLGIGDVGMETIWTRYSDPAWKVEGHLHNNVVQWAVTIGIVGLSAILAVFVRAWTAVWRIERELRGKWFEGSLALGGLAVMAGFHVNGLFEWNFGDTEIIMLIWAVLGLVFAASRHAAAAPDRNEAGGSGPVT